MGSEMDGMMIQCMMLAAMVAWILHKQGPEWHRMVRRSVAFSRLPDDHVVHVSDVLISHGEDEDHLRPEVSEYLRLNCTGGWRFEHRRVGYLIRFMDIGDATQFKLRWS